MSITDAHWPAETGLTALGVGPALIGPNAVIQVAAALDLRHGRGMTHAVFARAGLVGHLARAPEGMINEDDVARLQKALHEELDFDEAAALSREAGRRTADYLLTHRIPRPAQWLLGILPRRLAARLLVKAIARHAWTFAGSGRFSYGFDRFLKLRLQGGPVCRLLKADDPVCDYYAATFQGVFAAILGPTVQVREIACEAAGAEACVFTVSW